MTFIETLLNIGQKKCKISYGPRLNDRAKGEGSIEYYCPKMKKTFKYDFTYPLDVMGGLFAAIPHYWETFKDQLVCEFGVTLCD